jgi:hypothetical protein
MSRPGTYTSEQKQVRRALLAVYDPADRCPRCHRPLGPDPTRLDLGHTDDRAAYSGLEHARCNRAAGARLGMARRRARNERMRIMATEAALALEISEDRRHCSIVAAGCLDGDLVLLELAAYLDGTDPLAAVLQLRKERRVLAVVVDPHSHAATAIRPLEAADVKVTRPTSGDVAEAHGLFLDALAAGRIRHQGQAELTAAMRYLEQRRLGGATAAERRGALVDVSPAVAAELACWGLLIASSRPRPMLVVSNPNR